MQTKPIAGTMVIGAAVASTPVVAAMFSGDAEFLGPTPYLCADDSPFDLCSTPTTFALEDFEDGELNAAGVLADVGAVAGPGGLTDSVDCDDGEVDGLGQAGRSWFNSPGSAGILFTFDAEVLGTLPTSAGVVWTDGATLNEVIFEAFDANDQSLGQVVAENVGDGNFNSGTDEDRFFGVTHPGGISAIHIISNPLGSGTGIEVDHLQYGPIPNCPADTNFDLTVDVVDLLAVLAAWGPCADACAVICAADTNGDDAVDVLDLLAVLGAWGECP